MVGAMVVQNVAAHVCRLARGHTFSWAAFAAVHAWIFETLISQFKLPIDVYELDCHKVCQSFGLVYFLCVRSLLS